MADRILTLDEITRYLDLVRSGEGLTKSARRCGLDPRLVRNTRRDNPEFDEMVSMAELEATEPVESELYKAARSGEPWAVKLWLERRNKERWGEPTKTVQVNHTLDAAPGMERIMELQARLEQRQRMLGSLSTLELGYDDADEVQH